jgi:type IV pilus assembly protein PilM
MNLISGNQDFFGLDIGTTAVRLVELQGSTGVKTLSKYAYVPLEGNLAMSESKGDQQKLAKVIASLASQAKLTSNKVAVGIPSSRVFTSVSDTERLSPAELAKAIPLQADTLIPTPFAESKIDWAVLGDSPTDKTKLEILLSSVSNKFVESRLDMLESIGLNVIAFEPDNLAMARALASPDGTPQIILDIGHNSTDMVVVLNNMPHLTRSVPTGVEAIIRAATQNLNIDDKQANQFVMKFGMGKDKLEGQVYNAIKGVVENLATEIEKTIKFFETRYNGVVLERMIVTGGASVIPELPLYFANKFGINVEIGDAWRNVSFSRDRQNELLAISNQFGVAIGLAERSS